MNKLKQSSMPIETIGNLECCSQYQVSLRTDTRCHLSVPGPVPGERSGKLSVRVFSHCQGKSSFLNSNGATKKMGLVTEPSELGVNHHGF